MKTKLFPYGIDAPLVIRNLFLGCLLCIALDFWLQKMSFFGWSAWVGMALHCFLIGNALLFLAIPLGMCWSSSKGKINLCRKIVETMNLKGDETVLDLCCGSGLFLIEIAKKLNTGKVTGIDIWNCADQSGNSQKVPLANASLEKVANRVEVLTADMRDLPFKDESFNWVVSALGIHNLSGKKERDQAIREAYRVLRPGGRIVIEDFSHIDEYASALEQLNCSDLVCSSVNFGMIPPVKVLVAVKPFVKK